MKEYKISLQGKEFNLTVKDLNASQAVIEVNGKEYTVGIQSKKPDGIEPLKVRPVATASAAPVANAPVAKPAAAGGDAVVSPLPGVILDIKVNVGDTVKTGQTVVILEAMKMENEVRAHKDGTISEILVAKGATVNEAEALVKIGG